MNEPITYTDNKLHTECGDYPAELTMLFGMHIDQMLTVHFPSYTKSYLLPDQRTQLEDDVRKECAKHDALSFDTCEECRVADQ